MTMIEKVARAIYRCDPIPNAPFDVLVEIDKTYYLGRARAAIEAMRDPSLKMQTAGGNVHVGNDEMDAHDFQDQASEIWRAMIDAALKEE